MTSPKLPHAAFRATPIIDFQAFVAADKPDVPASYDLRSINNFWLASDRKLRVTNLFDQQGREFGVLVGFTYSEFDKRFLPAGDFVVPIEIEGLDDIETRLLPKLAGLFILLTAGRLPARMMLAWMKKRPTPRLVFWEAGVNRKKFWKPCV